MSIVDLHIKNQCEAMDISQRELAHRVEMPLSYVSQLECDIAELSIKSLSKITDILDAFILHLLPEEDKNKSTPDLLVRKNKPLILSLPESRLKFELLKSNLKIKMDIFNCSLNLSIKNTNAPMRRNTVLFSMSAYASSWSTCALNLIVRTASILIDHYKFIYYKEELR